MLTPPLTAPLALLVVDVQKGFINPHTEHVIPKIESLYPKYDIKIFTRFINTENSPHRRFLNWHRFDINSPEIFFALNLPSDALIFDKFKYTCVNEDFLEKLTALDVNEVHICG